MLTWLLESKDEDVIPLFWGIYLAAILTGYYHLFTSIAARIQ